MELEIINKLFLELSQVTTAKTAKELALQRQLDAVDAILWPNGNKPEHYEPERAVRLRAILSLRGQDGDAANDF